jgi:hypothetical protein
MRTTGITVQLDGKEPYTFEQNEEEPTDKSAADKLADWIIELWNTPATTK